MVFSFKLIQRNFASEFKLILGEFDRVLLSSVFVVSLFTEEGALDELRLYAQNPPLTDLLPATEPKYPKLFPEESFGLLQE